ncbi:hypothetical protein MPLSOD_20236 [Mesorhizobium sp. SOD10]|nr:hypothetical protein MPLSOD_20236 [Mesorhizobium sp. SOD10]
MVKPFMTSLLSFRWEEYRTLLLTAVCQELGRAPKKAVRRLSRRSDEPDFCQECLAPKVPQEQL